MSTFSLFSQPSTNIFLFLLDFHHISIHRAVCNNEKLNNKIIIQKHLLVPMQIHLKLNKIQRRY